MFRLTLIVCLGYTPDGMICVKGDLPEPFLTENGCVSAALAVGEATKADAVAQEIPYGQVAYKCEKTNEVMG